MILCRNTISEIDPGKVTVPTGNIFNLPERVLQFGTGVLLRGLPGAIIDEANRQGVFNGRIVVVKSTTHGSLEPFLKQDGLYTVCIRGPQKEEMIEKNIISSSISRVLSANEQWTNILRCAQNPLLKIIISNTTEIGIELVKDDIKASPPNSFPGKLAAFLYERFTTFGSGNDGDLVVIPTELIIDNGKKLKSAVLSLANENHLPQQFMDWIENNVQFCSSLVDRIVPGKPDNETLAGMARELGYEDELLIMVEPYHLWAIEADEKVKKILSFAEVDKKVIITPDIRRYRELKLRLLNGSHTMSCGLAFLAGFHSVYDAMKDASFFSYIKNLMLTEIASAIPFDLPAEEIQNFGLQVLERFRNPYIRHPWINICMHYTSKMQSRNIPVLLRYYEKHKTVPDQMALGFAAYLLFMKAAGQENEKYYGLHRGKKYFINDAHAGYYFRIWQTKKAPNLVVEVLSNQDLWQHDLSVLQGFSTAVSKALVAMLENGVASTILKSETGKISQS
jgi:Mannitol-1-phosphate/altronate dehydrogenases